MDQFIQVGPRIEAKPRRSSAPDFRRLSIIVGSAIYLILGLSSLGDVHDATLVGVSYLALGACHYLGHRRRR